MILQGIKNMFGGAGEAVEVTSLVEWYPVEKRGLGLGIQHAAYPWMTGIAAIAVGSILATFGPENWRYVFLIIPLAMIPIWIGWWVYSTKSRYAKFEKQVDDAGLTKPLAGGDRSRTGPRRARRSHAEPEEPEHPDARPSRRMFGIMIYTGISFWLPSYIAFVGGFSFAEAAAYSAVFTITGGIGQIFWGTMSDYLGRKTQPSHRLPLAGRRDLPAPLLRGQRRHAHLPSSCSPVWPPTRSSRCCTRSGRTRRNPAPSVPPTRSCFLPLHRRRLTAGHRMADRGRRWFRQRHGVLLRPVLHGRTRRDLGHHLGVVHPRDRRLVQGSRQGAGVAEPPPMYTPDYHRTERPAITGPEESLTTNTGEAPWH